MRSEGAPLNRKEDGHSLDSFHCSVEMVPKIAPSALLGTERAAKARSLRRSLLAAYTAGFRPSLALSSSRVLRVVRSSAARSAIAAGSSIRSGSPCRSRERRAPCAPALRIAIRSSVLSGARGGRRTSRRLPL
jgi:hypothetical protein